MPRRLVQQTNVYAGLLNPTIVGTNLQPGGTSGWSGASATLSTSATFRNGYTKLQVTVSASTGSASWTSGSLTGGKRYYFDIWVRGTSGTNGKFVRASITANGNTATQDTCRYQLSNTTWTRIRCSIYNTVTGTITITIAGNNLANNDVFYADDVYMDIVNTPVTTISNRRFYYNGVETFLRGSNYTNVITGGSSGTDFATEEGMLPFDFADLQTQGCNMTRIYYDQANSDGTLSSTIANDYGRGLDCAWNYGLGVMALYYIWLPGGDYSQATGTANRNTHISIIKNMVTALKTHPAIIAYGDGSEANYNLGSNSQTDWFTLLDAVCAGGKTIDNTRIYYTSNGGLPVPSQDSVYPNLDMIGFTSYGGNSGQVFRGSDLTVSLSTIQANTTKAVILTEIGSGCYDGSANGNQEYQGTTDVFLLAKAESFYPYFCGHTYFQTEDNRNTQNSTDNSWFGKAESLTTGAAQVRTKRTSFTAIQNYFNQHPVPGY